GDGAFIVTPAMMSILGATAEDMEEILKGLGYRGEAKPAAEVAGRIASLDATARAAAQAQAAEPAAQDHGDAMADPNVPATFAADATPEEGAAVETNVVDADANQPVSGPDLAAEPAAPDEASLSHDDVMADSNVSPAPAPADEIVPAEEIGRASCRERGEIAVVSGELKEEREGAGDAYES